MRQQRASDQLSPPSWQVWASWVFVCATQPIFSTITASTFLARYSEPLPAFGVVIVLIVATLVTPVLQGIVLKEMLLKLNVTLWTACALLAGAVPYLISFGRFGKGPPIIEAGFRTSMALQIAAHKHQLAGTLTFGHGLELPWAPWIIWTVALASISALPPSILLATMLRRSRTFFLFFVAAVLGQFVAEFVDEILKIILTDMPRVGMALNGISWSQRLEIMVVRCGIGAIFGAVTAVPVVLTYWRSYEMRAVSQGFLPTRRAPATPLLLIAPLAIALVTPLAAYLVSASGIIVGAPALIRAVSVSPWSDRSEGEEILSYIRDIDVPVDPVHSIEMAPGERYAIVKSDERALTMVDLESGKGIKRLGENLGPAERHSIVWSPDGRFLALRTFGQEVTVKGRFDGHQTRIRIYAWPSLAQLGEYQQVERTCYDAHAYPDMVFTSDRSLWAACGQKLTIPDASDLMAINLSVPAAQILRSLQYNDAAAGGQLLGLRPQQGELVAWQFMRSEKRVLVRDISKWQMIADIAMPQSLVGEMTPQTGQIKIGGDKLAMPFCGAPPNSPPEQSICRNLEMDLKTSSTVRMEDVSDDRVPFRQLSEFHGLKVLSQWRENSKTGEIIVADAASGRRLQTLTTTAMRLVARSETRRLLVTSEVYGNRLKLYSFRDVAR